ncbi:MAG: hypothetical protein K940chlam9_01661, partial [Chlamydiae bacterium]|nr:hypothetical protein [Chlamydiota bacterium]
LPVLTQDSILNVLGILFTWILPPLVNKRFVAHANSPLHLELNQTLYNESWRKQALIVLEITFH